MGQSIRMAKTAVWVGCLVLVVLAPQRAAWALPEDVGTYATQQLARTETIAGKSVAFDVFLPQGLTTPAPIVVLGHGFFRDKVMMRDWGKRLASRGYIAAAPAFGLANGDHAGNAKVLSGLLAWLVAEGTRSGSALEDRVDATRRAAIGHSAGGLSALLAAADDPSINVVVGLDPVDVGGQGVAAAAKITRPVAILRAVPGSCNDNGNAAALFAALAGPAFTLQVVGATHCDPEWPSDPACGLLCGGDDEVRRQRFVRYALATLDHVLRCDATMAPYLGGSAASADTAVTGVSQRGGAMPQLGCATGPDGGADATPPTDAGHDDGAIVVDGAGVDHGASLDAAVTSDGARGDSTPAPAHDGGCGCALCAAPPPGIALVALLFALVWGARRKRRRAAG